MGLDTKCRKFNVRELEKNLLVVKNVTPTTNDTHSTSEKGSMAK